MAHCALFVDNLNSLANTLQKTDVGWKDVTLFEETIMAEEIGHDAKEEVLLGLSVKANDNVAKLQVEDAACSLL